jgi:Nif-specific regulatory protein
MGESGPGRDAERVQRERDLYRRILELDSAEDLDPLLTEALGLIVDGTGALQGYLEVRDGDAEWWTARGCSSDEVEAIRGAISRGIVAEAIATGRTIVTPAALLDARFRDRESVRARRIGAVLCAPVGSDPPIGALYLERRAADGPFADEDRELAETFARHFAPRVDRLLARRRLKDADDPTRPVRARLRMTGVVGRSRALAAALEQAALVAPLEVNVLLTGESGTGKSQLARIIHENGPRAAGPFVELNCAAIPEALVENELFGHRAGAFTGAPRDAEGKVAAAEGGTLFLDEVGELHPAAQAKLLQLLQTREYFPLGESRPLRANVRLIAATNADLASAVAEKRFREDLFYRLQVLPIRLPSLAERREDVRELAEFFCREACRANGLARVELSPAALRAVEAAEWRGNLRQLAHAIEAAAIRAAGAGGGRVEPRHLFPEGAPKVGASADDASFQEATRRFQRELLQRTLAETDWNVTETARRLDLARSHVYNLIHAFELARDER